MKHVKKSMFISTVLMVVMLVAALSTATFAWYTSNNTASSNAVQVGAAQATSANIGIGFYKGATGSTITFQNLVNAAAQNAGTMNPVIPTKYFDEYFAAAQQTIPAAYATSTQEPSYYVEDAFGTDVDYRRIVDLTSAQVSQIVAASTVNHNWDGDVITNLSGLGTDYEHVYTIQRYAYNNTITTTVGTAPIAGDKITVTVGVNPGIYTIATTNPGSGTDVFKVKSVIPVNESTGYDDTIDHADVTTKGVTISLANRLSGATFTPNEDTFFVVYDEYHECAYTIADVTTFDSTAVSVGYAATAATTLNGNDILASEVLGTAAFGIGEIKYADNFAYIAQIYAGSATDDGTLTNKVNNAVNWGAFTFNKAAIDAEGFFQADGAEATIGAHYEGTSDAYTGATYDISVVTGKNTAGSASDTWYVTNNGSTPINLSVNMSTTGDNASLLRVALFMNGHYIGTLSGTSNQDTTYGKILKGARATDMPTYKATNTYSLGSLVNGNQNAAEFQIVAWFDGTLLNDAAAGKNCAFTLVFTAA